MKMMQMILAQLQGQPQGAGPAWVANKAGDLSQQSAPTDCGERRGLVLQQPLGRHMKKFCA